jgi:hypothetical protein
MEAGDEGTEVPHASASAEPDWADRVRPMPTAAPDDDGAWPPTSADRAHGDGTVVTPTDDELSGRWRSWALDTVPELARSARAAGARSVLNGGWLVDTTMAAAERIRPRDHATLTRHHRGRADAEIARGLVRNASLGTGAIGAAVGALVTFQEIVPPTWAVIPFELAAETAVVVAVELKLVGELHHLADRPIVGGGAGERSMLLVGSWAEKRGVSATVLLGGGDLLSRQTRNALARTLRNRLAGRMGRNLSSLIPLMAGAAAGAEINRRATRSLGGDLAEDLGFALD